MKHSAEQALECLRVFRRPGHAELSALRRILADADVSPPEGGSDRTKARPLCGTLDELMTRLEDILIEDYAENLVAEQGAPWRFDYVAAADGAHPGRIAILTRLACRRAPERGPVGLYGRTVQRVGANEYWLWDER